MPSATPLPPPGEATKMTAPRALKFVPRPIAIAALTEIDLTGHEVGSELLKQLTMNQQDGAGEATSVTLHEMSQVYCVTTPCSLVANIAVFKLVQTRPGNCGSTLYTAVESTPREGQEPRVMEVVDHRSRICEDYKKYLWELKLSTTSNGQSSIRFFQGNPQSTYAIQD